MTRAASSGAAAKPTRLEVSRRTGRSTSQFRLSTANAPTSADTASERSTMLNEKSRIAVFSGVSSIVTSTKSPPIGAAPRTVMMRP